MKKKITRRAFCSMLLALPFAARAQQAMNFEFIINLKAAKQIGITLPYELLARANQVIK